MKVPVGAELPESARASASEALHEEEAIKLNQSWTTMHRCQTTHDRFVDEPMVELNLKGNLPLTGVG